MLWYPTVSFFSVLSWSSCDHFGSSRIKAVCEQGWISTPFNGWMLLIPQLKCFICNLTETSCALTLPILLCAMWKAWSSLSFLKTGAGRVSIKFPLRFRTVKCTRQSRPSIFGMQLLAKWSSLNCVRWSSFSIFSIMWLFKFSWRSFLRFSKFSIYWKKVMKKTRSGYYPWVWKN